MDSANRLKTPLKRSFEQAMASRVDGEQNPSLTPQNFKPRDYQMKVFQIAKKRNTIAVLDTGAGKTMIAVMLIKDIGRSLTLTPHKRLIVFLAPTVNLVHQQYEVIKLHTDLAVEEYFGAKGVDEWNSDSWKKETTEHDVLVMTPQILLDALRKAYLSFEVVCLMIIDECHRATGNHAYTKIMKEFYHRSPNKPKIFGMTASPVTRKGVSSAEDCNAQIGDLESLLDSQIYTVENGTELEKFIPSAKTLYLFYNPVVSLNGDLKAQLNSSLAKYDEALLELQGSMPNYTDVEEKQKMLRKRLSNDQAKILCCLDDLGLICAYEAVKVCMENASNMKEECEFYDKSSSQSKYFLEELLSIVGKFLPCDYEKLLDIRQDCSQTVTMGYLSPKLYELFKFFESLGKEGQVLCLIFVDRIITARVIERILKKIEFLSHFSISYVTGSNSSVDAQSSKMQRQTLESFRSGKVNLLFATDVVEEGMNVPECSYVIRFDLPKTVRSYVQSRGRARKLGSLFVIMLERGNIKQRNQMFDIVRSEYSMKDIAINRDPGVSKLKAFVIKETDTYVVEATGASVTTDSSIDLIHKYCERLPRDKYFTPKPIFQFLQSEDLYQCKLILPPNAAFQTIVGPENRNSHLSKQFVCLDACKKLHEMGALNDHLLPPNEDDPLLNESIVKGKDSSPGAGTTKRKELHGMTSIRVLHGAWGDKIGEAVFQAYKIDFACSIFGQQYSNFVLLLESKLDDDVGNVEVTLHLVSKFVKSYVTSCGQVNLDAEQVMKAKRFQELFFNALFGKLFIKVSKERKFLLQTEEILWNQSNMYLLLPIESSQPLRINWEEIDACDSTVEFLKQNAWLNNEKSKLKNEEEHTLFVNRISTKTTFIVPDVIQLANKSVPVDNLREMVVLAIHTGRIYSVLEIVNNLSAESPFDGNCDAIPSKFSSFADYFNIKYGIVLTYPDQPLLLLKQSHNAHNLLVDFKKEGSSHAKKSKEGTVEQLRNHVHMPPELLVSIGVRIGVLKSFYLLPSLMHRLESLMLASQIREDIASHFGNHNISSSLILEALTTLRCNEGFSMERLELLGDSVLKFTLSCYLFLKYPKMHEGKLSSQRSQAVCNSTLYKLGVDRKIQGYIRDSAFEPRRWAAPGQLTIRHSPCKHGLDSLEVPLDAKFHTQDPNIVVGKNCDRGHRWMGSKTISDCVEALIGAYYVGGGLLAALHLMKWLGINAEVEPSLIADIIRHAALRSYAPKNKDIEALETKVGYVFSVKGLLMEAITHASEQEQGHGVGYCYQRLEFLGDSVLDILITVHLYQTYTDIDPGDLTDLRSASVNNDSFAHAAVKKNLHEHLQHCSGFLLGQITEYLNSVSECSSTSKSLQGIKSPKALGDLVESIAGAILIDTKLNLDVVWRIFKPLLSIPTPETLELAPHRELVELCASLGYFIKEKCTTNGDQVHAKLSVQMKDVMLVGEGCGQNKKHAKGKAAICLLKDLEDRGISYSKKKKLDGEQVDNPSSLGIDLKKCSQIANDDSSKPRTYKKLKVPSLENDSCGEVLQSDKPQIPVLESIDMKKGGPRTTLFTLCKKLQWPRPAFKSTEHKSRSPIDFGFGDGDGSRKYFSSFESDISLTIPNDSVIELKGDQKADKKSSFDSAAILMLYELQRQGKLIISSVIIPANSLQHFKTSTTPQKINSLELHVIKLYHLLASVHCSKPIGMPRVGVNC